MTPRERLLAVANGREHDRVSFAQYSNFVAPNEELQSLLGPENVGAIGWAWAHTLAAPNCARVAEDITDRERPGQRTVLHTPEGDLTEERFFEPAFNSAAISKHLVTQPGDWKVLAAYLQDVVVREAAEQYLEVDRSLGDIGVAMASLGRTPFQQLWVQWVSLEDLCAHMVDLPDAVEECMSLLADIHRRIFRAAIDASRKVSIAYFDFADNITAPVIGPKLFRRWCMPLYQEFAAMAAEVGVPVFCHMDGDLRPLRDLIGGSKLDGIESFSPPPDNDTSVADALAAWPYMRIFANFPSSMHLAEPKRVYEKAMEMLEQARGTGRLAIQISENVPPGLWRRSLPEIVRAISDFGRPM